MKKIYKIVLTLAAVFALNLTASAQKTKADGDMPATPPDGLVLDKTVKPDPAKPGSYMINMEAWAEGDVHVENVGVPADIVLVLDVSGSMAESFTSTTYSEATPSGNNGWTYQNTSDRYIKYGDNYYRINRSRYHWGTNKYYLWFQDNEGNYYYLQGDDVKVSTDVIENNYYSGWTWDPEDHGVYFVTNQNNGIYTGTLYSATSTTETKIAALKRAVRSFITKIQENDAKNASTPGWTGNRIAIVTFASNVTNATNGFVYSNSTTLTSVVNGLPTSGGTRVGGAMELAYTLLNESSDAHIKTAVLFTDGDPGDYGCWTIPMTVNGHRCTESDRAFTWQHANDAIKYAGQIKKLEDLTPTADKDKYYAKVYTVGIFDNPSNYTKVYMKKASSDFDKTTTNMGSWNGWTNTDPAMYTENGDGNMVETDDKYTFNATSSEELENIFKSISENAGGATFEAATGSSVIIDVVSNSFSIPSGTDADRIIAYYVNNVQTTKNGGPVWEEMTDTKKAAQALTVDKTKIGQNEVSVSGFDYTTNWVGWDAPVGQTPSAHGAKVVLEIPIDVNDDAVGGPKVFTNNASKTKFVVKDVEGNEKGSYAFPVPNVALPVTIKIQKQGLQPGESAKFTIVRWLPTENEPTTEAQLAAAFYREVILTNDGKSVPQVTIKGLDPKYYYKIIESTWAWSYQYLDPVTQQPVDVSSQSTQEVEVNPFVFYNRKDENVDKHAESSKRNVLKETETVVPGNR